MNSNQRQVRQPLLQLVLALSLLLMLSLVASPISASAQDATPDDSAGDVLDTDGDELSDEEELEIGIDLTLFDTDGDALSDGSEVREDGWGTDPLNGDTDGDSYWDGDELFTHGTDPNDPESRPAGQQAQSTISIEIRVLPVGYDDNDFVVDSKPLPDVDITVAIPGSDFGTTAFTNASGQAVFEGLGEGEYVVILSIPGDAADFLTFFGTEDGFEPRQHDGQDTNQPVVYLGPDEVLNGTFYVIPVDNNVQPEPTEPAPTPVPTAEPVTALPSTGTGGTVEASDVNQVTGVVLTLLLVLTGLFLRRRVA